MTDRNGKGRFSPGHKLVGDHDAKLIPRPSYWKKIQKMLKRKEKSKK